MSLHVRQVKQGRYGEGVFVKRLANPLQTTHSFAGQVMGFLVRVDPRFRQMHFGAVAAFAPTADITGIYDPSGLIYTTELADFSRLSESAK